MDVHAFVMLAGVGGLAGMIASIVGGAAALSDRSISFAKLYWFDAQ